MSKVEQLKIGIHQMTASLSPVTDATRFLIHNHQIKAKKSEALGHYNRLVEWISDPTHLTDYEAIRLASFFGQILAKQNVIKTEQLQELNDRLIKHETPDCPTHKINGQVNQLIKSDCLTRELGLEFFERIVQWIAACQKDEGDDDDGNYGSSITSIYSLVIDCYDKQLITDEEKKILFNRAYQAIIKIPGRKIKDPDLVAHFKWHVLPYL